MSKKIKRKEINLEEMVRSGPEGAYEALQLYKSKVNRLKQKGSIDEAIITAHSGARIFLSLKDFETAATELAKILIELFIEFDKELNLDNRNIINEIDQNYSEASASREEFLKLTLKWNVKTGTRTYGDPMINVKYADSLWYNNKHAKSIYHYVVGEAPENLSDKINEAYFSSKDSKDIDTAAGDKLIILAVAHFLAIENLRDANILLRRTMNYIAPGEKTPSSPYLLLCSQLIQVCRRDVGAGILYKKLCNANAAYILECEPTVQTLLEGPIALHYFNIRPPPNMMNMLLGL